MFSLGKLVREGGECGVDACLLGVVRCWDIFYIYAFMCGMRV